MSEITESEITEQLTGFCTFLVQGPPFHEGDVVDLVFQRDDAGPESAGWLALKAIRPTESRDRLENDERTWGTDVVLVRTRLSRTGGTPLDSLNQPMDGHNPDALTLSDVRVVDRSPPHDEVPVETGSDR